MLKKRTILKLFVLMTIFVGQAHLAAQKIHYSTLHDDCEETETTPEECCEAASHCHHHRFPSQQPDKIAEEQYEDAGWPGRRDELSDILMR